jgi:hypothetical protein
MEVSGQHHTPAALPHRKKTQYPLNKKLGGPQVGLDRFGEDKNLFPLLGFKPWTIQPTASHYTTYAIPAPIHNST